MFLRRMVLVWLTIFCVYSARADTTVVKVVEDDFPYPESVRVFVDNGVVHLECSDEYGRTGTRPVDPDRLHATLSKASEWMELNKSVKTNVKKELEYADYDPKNSKYGFGFMSFIGLESGQSFLIISVGAMGSACTVEKYSVDSLINGLEYNLENTRTEDRKNKADLFK